MSQRASDPLPAWIGRYKVLRILGEGGMGIVYLARQEHPIERTVAVKVIKPGMDSVQVIARFEAERQALALLDHPNIARVLDAGTTDQGRPYFVMEYVEGLSITEYCDEHKLTVCERLMLFLDVCGAIQHAHHKGIIHRDIKPSNVLVSVEDGRSVPKVIDFGVAKALAGPLSGQTGRTTEGQFVGTPEYMSPEQMGLSCQDADTRCDIYSLGLLLYELLTGTTPFIERDLHKVDCLEMKRIIQEDEPMKPSTKLRLSDELSTGAAENRRTTPEALVRQIRGDLDWIVMKALEKDRVRRYDTANGLAMDIRRHLKHEPVLARGPSTTYRLHKLLRRHRSHVAAALVVAVAIGALAVVLPMWNHDRLRLAEAQKSRDAAAKSRDMWLLSLSRERVAKGDYPAALESIAPILQSEHVGPEARLLYAGILVESQYSDEAATMLEGLLDSRPEIAGAAYWLLARVLLEDPSTDPEKLKKVNEYRREAEELLPETAEAYLLRAMTALVVRDKLDLLDKALRLDPGHYESFRMRAFTYCASREYDRMRDDALAMIVLRPQHPLGYSLRAMALHELGRFSEAAADYDRALALTPIQDPQYVELTDRLCEVLMRTGQYERVVAEAQDCLRNAPNAPVLQSQVFCALTAMGEYEQARTLMQSCVELRDSTDDQVRLRSMKHVFETLTAGGLWHPQHSRPEGAAFFYMHEAEEMYHALIAKARPLITNCFSPSWSPDGTKVAYTQGLPGYSGVAVYDLKSKKTSLLIVPGKNPRWSPDGRHIAFVRDTPTLRLSELTTGRTRGGTRSYKLGQEVWVMQADGSAPRRLAHRAHCPSWSDNGQRVYYRVHYDEPGLHAISIADPQAQPVAIRVPTSERPTMSPQGDYIANVDGSAERAAVLRIVDVVTQSCVAEWPTPLESPTGTWSPDGREISLGGLNGIRARTGLWIYDLAKGKGVKVLSGHFGGVCWSLDRTRLLIPVGKPYWEVWVADLDPNLSTAESLMPVQTLEEHCLESIVTCTRDLDVDPDSYVDRWTRTVSALWIGHPDAPTYLRDLDLRLGRPPFRPSRLSSLAAAHILAHPVLCERLGDLAWVLARRAVEQQPGHAEELAPLFEGIGQHEHATRLWQIAQENPLAGSHQYDKGVDTYTVVGGGAGLGGPMDEFHFLYEDLVGDGSITARIESIEGVHQLAMAGVMIRASLDPDSAFAAVFATASSGVSYHVRVTNRHDTMADDYIATPEQARLRAPVWIRIERRGDQFSALYSSDGMVWTPMAWSPQKVSMPHSVYIGLAITSHQGERTAEARISNVTTIGEVDYSGQFKQSQDIRLQLPPPPPQ